MIKRLFGLILVVVMISAAALSADGASTIGGEVKGEVRRIADGVTHTYAELEGSEHGVQKINYVEIDLSKKNLYIETLLGGKYIVSKSPVGRIVQNYNEADTGKTVLAAVNADLWMTAVHSGEKVSTKVLAVPRGVVIMNGEILCSSQNYQESVMATNGEGAATFWAFGVTDDYVPVIGQPIVGVSVRNASDNVTVTADGLNRLPADNSLVVYNDKCNFSNYALADAKEIVLEDISGEFKHGATVKGKVKSIGSGGVNIGEGDVILTARGDKVALLDSFGIGDKVEISLSITETARGESELWQRVQNSVGGHIPVVLDGVSTGVGDNTRYPATIVGYKNDGTVIFFQCDGRQGTAWSQGLSFSEMDEVMIDLGVNSAINLDGGGSSTMVVEGEVVNRPSDGGSRAVINAIAVMIGPERGAQGEFEVSEPYEFDARYLAFDNANACGKFLESGANCAAQTFVEGAARLSATQDTNDPYIYLDISGAVNTISADDYKYIVLKYKPSADITTKVFEIFLCAGSVKGPTGGRSTAFEYGSAGTWNTKIVDLTADSGWSGDIYGLRFDFIGGDALSGQYVDVEYVAFAKTSEEAKAIADGTAEIPSVAGESNKLELKDGSGASLSGGLLSGISNKADGYAVFSLFKNSNMRITDKDGLGIRSALVGTGYIISALNRSGKVTDSATIIVEGDINGDGEVNVTDYILAKRTAANTYKPDDIEKKAGDYNGDGVINGKDFLGFLKRFLRILEAK